MNPEELARLLNDVVCGEYTDQQVSRLVRIGFQFSLSRLKYLQLSGKLHLQSFQISIEGVAFDCLAELFRRDEGGTFTELVDYFSNERHLEELSSEEVVHHFRSLIYTKVQDGIFRLYREHDPVLARIIRNIKIAVSRNEEFHVEHRLGLLHVYTCPLDDRLDHLPQLSPELVEARMDDNYSQRSDTLGFLRAVFSLLNQQEENRRFYPLLDLALILKRIHARRSTPLAEIFQPDELMVECTVADMVQRTLSTVEKQFRKKYVESGKLERRLFDFYMAAIRSIIDDTFINNDGSDRSQPEYLAEQIPGLSKPEYRSRHRLQFEYMVRASKRIVREEIRELFS